MIKLSEQVRRLEDSIESLRAENKKLKAKVHESEVIKKPMLKYKWTYTIEDWLPTSGNKDWDLWICDYTYYWQDIHSECVRYKDRWVSPIEYENLFKTNPLPDERDEIIDHQKWDIVKLRKEIDRCKKLNDTLINNARSDEEKYKKLEKELWARLKQVEDLQGSYKTLQKENERLKSKLEQTVDEYDEDYKTFHKDDFVRFDENFKKIFWDFLDGKL